MTIFYVSVFLLSSFVLAVAGDWLVRSLARIARYFRWQEFIAAFFIMSFAVSVPELLVGITAATQGIPELSFGNIVGANVIHFTLAIALAALVLGRLEFNNHLIRVSADFAIIIAILPFVLMLDGNLSRFDGIILITLFFLYTVWVFSKKERFSELYKPEKFLGAALSPLYQFKRFLKDIGIFLFGIILLLLAAQGIVSSATFFAQALDLPLVIVGIFIIGLGTALPETYFSAVSARRGNQWMVIGNLLGSTVFTASFVLGMVALIHPIVITDFSPYVIARIFLIIAALSFLLFIRTDKKLKSWEALFLLTLYILFLLVQLVVRYVG